MIIIINKTTGISAAPIDAGGGQGIAAALHAHWPTGLTKKYWWDGCTKNARR
tara:strand:+ start:309 stop:464 length:156 start_codon:yes stop_codon:yes gene_type:complete